MQNTVKTNWVKIYICGELEMAKYTCQRYCDDIGLCVTIEKCFYIYSMGNEEGLVIGLINYPRFPSSKEELFSKAQILAEKLRTSLKQDSFCIMTPEDTYWHTNRENQNTGF